MIVVRDCQMVLGTFVKIQGESLQDILTSIVHAPLPIWSLPAPTTTTQPAEEAVGKKEKLGINAKRRLWADNLATNLMPQEQKDTSGSRHEDTDDLNMPTSEATVDRGVAPWLIGTFPR